MDAKKYGKYIITELKQNIVEAPWGPPVPPVSPGKGGRIMFLDNEYVPGAFYLECVWIMPNADGAPRRQGPSVKPHVHGYDEVLCFFGTDPADFRRLNAEVELWIGDEQHMITRSCTVFIPKGLQHCPLQFHRVDKPVFHFTTGPGREYF